jgi:hypothetical protein
LTTFFANVDDRRLTHATFFANLKTKILRYDFSGTTRASATVAAERLPEPVGDHERRPDERPLVPLELHLAAAACRAVPDVALRPVHAAQQHHGHRQHLRAGRATALLGGRVGAQHPLLPRPAGHRPGGAAQARVERTVCPERVAVLHAAARGAAAGRRRPPRLAHGRRPRRRLHGPHPHLPGASRETQGAARRLRRVQLSQSHRPLHHR